MDTLLQDLRFAARTLLRNRGFTLIAVLTLALGIGANTAIFSVLRGILLKPLPYQEPDRAVMLWSHWKGWDKTWLSGPEIVDYSQQSQVFSGLAPFDDGSFTLTDSGDPERVRGGLVAANLFSVLQVSPILGRTFTPEEDQPNGPRVVVLGEDIWRRRFNSDPTIIGRAIQLNAVPYTVLGVMPGDFRLPLDYSVDERTQLWTPLQLGVPDENDRGSHGLYAVGRLQAGVDPAQGQRLMDAFVIRMKADHPQNYGAEFGVTLVSLPDQILGGIRPALVLLFGAVALVLLIACGNVANLLLARGEARQREIAIRTALGAGRRRLARQLLTESVLLSVVGGGVGILFAWWGVEVLPAINPSSLPRADAIGIDLSVLGATVVLSLVTGIVFGMVPAWQMLRDVHPELRENTRNVTTGRRGRSFRRILVGVEVMIAMILVTGAGLVIRSFHKLSTIEPGFEPHGVLTMRLSLPDATYPTRTAVAALYTRLFERLRALPGVQTAGAVAGLPLASIRGDWGITIEGYTPTDPTLGTQADWQVVRPDYFEAMGIPLKKGRWLTDADGSDAPPVIMVNEAMVQRYWPDRDPIGQRLHLNSSADSNWRTVVGVVGNVHHRGLTETPRPEMYLPHAQFFATAPDTVVPVRSMTLTLRVRGAPESLTGPVRQVLADLDRGLAVSDIRSLDDVVSRSIAAPRFTTALLSVFAALALVLAAIGIYGVLSFIVAQRTAELGIRVALGATASDVLRLVLGQGMRPVIIGLVVGLLAALALARVLQGFLFDVAQTDPGTYVTVTVVLSCAAILACYLPARRAARVDPMTALRAE
ncbi:MAG TPA: ABC transporter permease [Gemmatimonadales bacterium]|nr:ABC transporter permease [Gemmatimonadales bacterium]